MDRHGIGALAKAEKTAGGNQRKSNPLRGLGDNGLLNRPQLLAVPIFYRHIRESAVTILLDQRPYSGALVRSLNRGSSRFGRGNSCDPNQTTPAAQRRQKRTSDDPHITRRVSGSANGLPNGVKPTYSYG